MLMMNVIRLRSPLRAEAALHHPAQANSQVLLLVALLRISLTLKNDSTQWMKRKQLIIEGGSKSSVRLKVSLAVLTSWKKKFFAMNKSRKKDIKCQSEKPLAVDLHHQNSRDQPKNLAEESGLRLCLSLRGNSNLIIPASGIQTLKDCIVVVLTLLMK